MHSKPLVDEEDIITTYKKEGKIKSYNYAVRYLEFSRLKNTQAIQDLSKTLKSPIRTLMHWIKEERTPVIIQIINELKNKRCVPLLPSEKLARIVGFIHGDGWVTNDLRTVGFSSSEKKLLQNIQKDTHAIFRSIGKIKKTIRIGEKVIILGKERTARKTGYRLQIYDSGIARCLYLVSGIKGKKTFKDVLIPMWIMNGNQNYKIAFLQGLFDSEMSNFQTSTDQTHEKNILQLRMEMCKCEKLILNLYSYFQQIKNLLDDIGIESSIKGPKFVRIDRNGENILKYSILIKNNLRNIYNFIDKIGFCFSMYKKKKSQQILRLVKRKIREKNNIYMVLKYIVNKSSFTTLDLEKDLSINKGYTKLITKLLWEMRFVKRSMVKEPGKGYIHWYKYTPLKRKIKHILKNELMLLDIVPGTYYRTKAAL